MTGHVIHLSTEIAADTGTVWSVLTDLAHTSDILRSVRSVDRISDGDYGVGTTWHESRSIFGHRGDEELVVTESDPPHRTIHETTLGHDRVRTSYSIQPSPHGPEHAKLLLTASVDVHERRPGGNLLWNTWGNIGFERTRRMLAHDLEDIKAAAERRVATAASAS